VAMGKRKTTRHAEHPADAHFPEQPRGMEPSPIAGDAGAAKEDIRAAPAIAKQASKREDEKTMPANAIQTESQNAQRPSEGVSVIGEAVRAVTPETAEFVIEISGSATTAAQSIRDNQMKSTQIAQAMAPLGVQPADLQTISFNVHNLFSPNVPALNVPQNMQAVNAYSALAPMGVLQPDVQFGSFHARKTLRVRVREIGRIGEIADAAARAGAAVLGGFAFKASDETVARKAALEAAGKDARAKAETLAAAAGRQLGDAVSISEDIIVSNGVYAALRNANPFAFSAGTPQMAGELEYYARVSARFRLQ